MLVIDEGHILEHKVLGFTDFDISPFSLQKYSVAIPIIEDGDIVAATDIMDSRSNDPRDRHIHQSDSRR